MGKNMANVIQWRRLKDMQCPKCGGTLKETTVDGYQCEVPLCRMYISYDKFRSIINGLYQPKKYPDRTEERNRNWLNEL